MYESNGFGRLQFTGYGKYDMPETTGYRRGSARVGFQFGAVPLELFSQLLNRRCGRRARYGYERPYFAKPAPGIAWMRPKGIAAHPWI
jgi:hypothetical protein